MIKLKDLRNCSTVEELEALKIGDLNYSIGDRGGYLGFRAADIMKALKIDEYMLPKNSGAHSNYHGGGIRCAICTSDYSKEITGKKKELLDALLAACKRAYESVENEAGLNDDEYPDGDTNWDAQATKAVRAAGVKSYPGL